MSTASKVFLHIGLHKTGTTYVQSLLGANREALRSQGVDFPGGRGDVAQTQAVFDLTGRRAHGDNDPRVAGSWDALVRSIADRGLPVALISEERLSLCSRRQARNAVGSFPDAEVHVLVTARDLGRVVVSSWQQAIKADSTWSWSDYVAGIKDPDRRAQNPARTFWMQQDLAAICGAWERVVPADRIHIITVPRSGSSPSVLLDRLASVVGFDHRLLTESPSWSNETLGVAVTEVIRRLNERLDGRLNQRQHDRIINQGFATMVGRQPRGDRFTLPDEELPWVARCAAETIEAVRARGYDVVGDLAELEAADQGQGRRPDDATTEELLEASLDALASMAERYANVWWRQRKAVRAEVAPRRSPRARARRLLHSAKRTAGHVADRNQVVGKTVSAGLRLRNRSGAWGAVARRARR